MELLTADCRSSRGQEHRYKLQQTQLYWCMEGCRIARWLSPFPIPFCTEGEADHRYPQMAYLQLGFFKFKLHLIAQLELLIFLRQESFLNVLALNNALTKKKIFLMKSKKSMKGSHNEAFNLRTVVVLHLPRLIMKASRILLEETELFFFLFLNTRWNFLS